MTRQFLLAFLASLSLMAGTYYERTFTADDPLKDFANNKEITRKVVEGNVLEVSTRQPSGYCGAKFNTNLKYDQRMLLVVEYRNIIPEGKRLSYTGLGVYIKELAGDSCFFALPQSREWSTQKVKMCKLKLTTSKSFIPEDSTISAITLYNRENDNEEYYNSTLQIRSIRIEEDPNFRELSDARLSYSAIPFLSWGPRGKQPENAEYTVTIREIDTRNVVVEDKATSNYYVTPEPLKPGNYEATVVNKADQSIRLFERLIVPERHHSWKMPEVDWARIAATPHPRLLPLAYFYYPKAPPKGSRLKGFMPPKDPRVWKEGDNPEIRAWIEWYGKIGGLISRTGVTMREIGQNAMMTGDKEMTETAKKALLYVARTWDPDGASNVRRCDLQCGNLLLGMCWCYDAAYASMTPEERADAEKALLQRGQQFMDSSCPFTSNEAQNHPWDRAQKASFVALTLAELPGMQRWFDYIAKLYAYRFIPSLGFDGENNEGLGYWSYGVGLVIRQVDAARQLAGINYYEHPWLKRTARFPLYCAPAMGYAMPFGDCGKPIHSLRGPFNGSFTAKLATEAGDAEALWYAGFAGTEEFQAKSPATIPQSIYYPHLGMAFFNTFLPDARENVAVAFRSGKFFAGHQHNDLNTFNINAYGDKLAIDGGYYDWSGSPHHQRYTIQTVAHNTILFNGEGQEGCKPDLDGYILGYLDCDDFGYVAGDAATSGVYKKELKRFDRQLLFIKPDYVLAYDTLVAETPSTYSWLIHSHTEKAMDYQADGTFRIERPDAWLTGRLFADAPITLRAGEAYTVMPVNGYSIDPVPNRQLEWTLTGENAAPVKTMHYLAAMRIGKSAWPQGNEGWEQKPLPQGGAAIRNRDFIAIFPGEAETAEAFGLKTDGRAAALLFDNGKVRSACAVNATTLQYKGRVLASSMQKGNLTLTKPVMQELDWSLSLDGKAIPCESYSFKYANGREVYHLTGNLGFDANKRLLIRCTPPQKGTLFGGLFGKKREGMVHIRLSKEGQNRGVSFKPGEEYALPVQPGRCIISFSSELPFGSVELKTAQIKEVPCEMKEVGWNPPEGAILHEAEVLESQEGYDGRSAKVSERESASSGKASVGWDVDGQSGVWAISIPEDGEYRLFIRTASNNYKLIIRELFIDGKPFSPNWHACSWGTTGGFGYAPAEWRWVAVPGTISLKAGIHRLGMAVYIGSSNLDAFAFVKQ